MTHWAAPDAWDVTVKAMDVAMLQEELASRFRLQLLQGASRPTTFQN